jgi:hypothetical protein
MKKSFPRFLFWFAIFFILHFLVCTLLSRTVSRLVSENDPHNTPLILLLSLPLNLLSLPMRIIWFGFRTAHFSVWVVRAMQIFNSVIWGTVLGLVALFAKRTEQST